MVIYCDENDLKTVLNALDSLVSDLSGPEHNNPNGFDLNGLKRFLRLRDFLSDETVPVPVTVPVPLNLPVSGC